MSSGPVRRMLRPRILMKDAYSRIEEAAALAPTKSRRPLRKPPLARIGLRRLRCARDRADRRRPQERVHRDGGNGRGTAVYCDSGRIELPFRATE